MKDNIAESEINILAKICENFIPIFFPKKPDIIELASGKNIIAYSILTFQRTYFFNMN